MPFLHAALRLKTRKARRLAALFAGIDVVIYVLLSLTPANAEGTDAISTVGGLGMLGTMIVGCVLAAPLRRMVYDGAPASDEPAVDPAIKAALAARARREEARKLADTDPSLAAANYTSAARPGQNLRRRRPHRRQPRPGRGHRLAVRRPGRRGSPDRDHAGEPGCAVRRRQRRPDHGGPAGDAVGPGPRTRGRAALNQRSTHDPGSGEQVVAPLLTAMAGTRRQASRRPPRREAVQR